MTDGPCRASGPRRGVRCGVDSLTQRKQSGRDAEGAGLFSDRIDRKDRIPCGVGRYRAEAGKLPGRASRGCAVADATLKQASCGVIPVARPSAAPGRLGNRLRRSRKFLEAQEVDNFPSFPMLRSSFSNPAGRPEALRSHAAAGETQFQPDVT